MHPMFVVALLVVVFCFVVVVRIGLYLRNSNWLAVACRVKTAAFSLQPDSVKKVGKVAAS